MSEEISKSKKKRLEMAEARNKMRKQKATKTFLAIFIPIVILAIVVALVLYEKKLANDKIIDYDKYLAEDGCIANINVKDYIQMNYKDMSFSKESLLPDDETIDADISSILTEHEYIPENDTKLSVSGDKVNISYKSSIDGVSYNEITSESGGADFTIGDAVISESFDEALINHKKGDSFTTSVSYDADYSIEDLAGKTVDYEITFNGVYVQPEFNDDFVKEYLSDKASTAEEYRVYLVNNYYESNLSNAITDSLSSNYIVTKYPEDYLANSEKVLKAQAQEQFEYYNEMYTSYGMEEMENLYEMYGLTSEEELDNKLHETALEETATLMAYQSIYQDEGLTNTSEEVREYFSTIGYDDDEYNSYLTQYGYNYLASIALQGRVLMHLVDTVNVTP